MADVNYVTDWKEEATRCKNCKSFQKKEGKTACVPPDKTFKQALEAFGEAAPNGHCDYFQKK